MIVTRWQASVLPTAEQVKMIFEAEGLEPQEEVFPQATVLTDHRHPFDEVRMVVAGALFLNVSGNQVLLRPGDRIEIPANTRHSKSVEGSEPCVSVFARRPF
jgi:quercetin dioxygenase-like cupin family protein